MTNPADPGPTPGAPPPTPPPPSPWRPPVEEPGPAPGVKFASHGPRLVAYIVDGFILSVVLTVLFAILSAIFFSRTPDFLIFTRNFDLDTGEFRGRIPAGMFAAFFAVFGVFFLVSLLITLAYFPLSWARSGQTPGMRLFGLYVVRDSDGGKITMGQAVLRVIGLWVAAIPFLLGFIWIFIDARRRGWHDLIAGTVVVERHT